MNADMSNFDEESDMEELPLVDSEIYGYPDYEEPQYDSSSSNESFSYEDKYEGTSSFTKSLIAKSLAEYSEADKILNLDYENERTNEAGSCSFGPTLPHPKEIDLSIPDEESDMEEVPFLNPNICGSPDYEEPQYDSSYTNDNKSSIYENERTNEDGSSSDSTLPHPKDNLAIPRMKKPYIVQLKAPLFDFSMSDCLKQRKIKPTNKTIGFLGFTKVAQGIMKNLCYSGHSVIICEEEPDFNGHRNLEECKIFAEKLNIKIVETPARVFKAADIIFNYVSNYKEDQYFQFIETTLYVYNFYYKQESKKGYVEMTTIPSHISADIANKFQSYEMCYLEAPFCGSIADASKGTLCISISGDKKLYDDCKSCFDAISEYHVYISPENGIALKMNTIYNMTYGTTCAVLAEKMALLKAAGLDEVFIEVLKMSDLNNSELVHKAQLMLDKNFETETSVHEMLQQFDSGLKLAREFTLRTPIFAAANELYKRAEEQNYGSHDVSAVIQATKP